MASCPAPAQCVSRPYAIAWHYVFSIINYLAMLLLLYTFFAPVVNPSQATLVAILGGLTACTRKVTG